MKERIDNLVRSHREDLLDMVLSFLGKLATVIGLMAGAGALIRFRHLVLPSAPELASIVAILLMFVSFGLMLWVAFSGWHRLAEVKGYSWGSHMYGLLLMIFSILFSVAGFHAAIS